MGQSQLALVRGFLWKGGAVSGTMNCFSCLKHRWFSCVKKGWPGWDTATGSRLTLELKQGAHGWEEPKKLGKV